MNTKAEGSPKRIRVGSEVEWLPKVSWKPNKGKVIEVDRKAGIAWVRERGHKRGQWLPGLIKMELARLESDAEKMAKSRAPDRS